jgi:limonene-1,2-epoxide hydrolase
MTGVTRSEDESASRGAGASSRLPLIVVTLILLVILLLCGALVYGQVAQAMPNTVVRVFMDALARDDYQAAYAAISASGQRHWASAGSAGAEANFARYAAALDRRYGGITGYQPGVPIVQGVHATVLVAVQRVGVRDEVDALGLSRQGSGWAIDTYSPGVPTVAEGTAVGARM